jgi:hypothetical protein
MSDRDKVDTLADNSAAAAEGKPPRQPPSPPTPASDESPFVPPPLEISYIED